MFFFMAVSCRKEYPSYMWETEWINNSSKPVFVSTSCGTGFWINPKSTYLQTMKERNNNNSMILWGRPYKAGQKDSLGHIKWIWKDMMAKGINEFNLEEENK